MIKRFKADLHIHTCLSPCGDLEMSPRAIIEQAKRKGLDIIAICDHNSAENVAAVSRAAQTEPLKVLPGMEVTSQEEVHVIALFDEIENVLNLQKIVYENLSGENDEQAFGMQVVVNELGDVLSFNKKLLIGATELPVEKVVTTIHSLNGLAIASHIDRESFSILGQLGFIPDYLDFDGLEISCNMTFKQARSRFPSYNHYGLITSSDAHYLSEIGRCFTELLIQEASIKEFRLALFSQEGRKVLYWDQ